VELHTGRPETARDSIYVVNSDNATLGISRHSISLCISWRRIPWSHLSAYITSVRFSDFWPWTSNQWCNFIVLRVRALVHQAEPTDFRGVEPYYEREDHRSLFLQSVTEERAGPRTCVVDKLSLCFLAVRLKW